MPPIVKIFIHRKPQRFCRKLNFKGQVKGLEKRFGKGIQAKKWLESHQSHEELL